jgi:Flp pilus assembly protein TadB
MNIFVRAFAAAFIVCLSAAHVARAQELPMSDRQKAEIAKQKAFEKATDQAYEAAMKRTRDVKPKAPVDPWANVRAPAAGGGN